VPRTKKKRAAFRSKPKKSLRNSAKESYSAQITTTVPATVGVQEIATPNISVIAVRVVIILTVLFLGAKFIGAFNPFKHTSNSNTPTAIISNEMSKPVTERRMTETFEFDGVKTKWGYSGWTKDGSANPNKDEGIYTGQALGINAVKFDSGIGTQAPSEIVFDLKGKVKNFSCKVGVDGGGNDVSSVIFKVYGDKKKLFQSPVMKVNTPALPIQLDVSGYQELDLKVDPVDPSGGWDQADWVDIKFE
jgi:hypothetical protein